jgi:hypothetical protein
LSRSHLLHALVAAILVVAGTTPSSKVFAQTIPGAGPPSVLPSGGGAALLDASDTVILLLDHQSGLFQTVKDISVAELRANTSRANDQASYFVLKIWFERSSRSRKPRPPPVGFPRSPKMAPRR